MSQTDQTPDTTVPTRAEMAESDTWDLRQLFADVGKWQEDFRWVEQTGTRITEWKGRIGESAATLAEILEFEKQVDLKIERLYHFASLQLAEDGANTEYLGRFGQLQNLLTKLGELSAFVVPEIQAIEDQRFDQYLSDPALADWR
ncbi:MAG TPA: oligoendopeptidase F, partial [Chthoniobacterales bacterium]|nr:oligoendopeptidase F [Chthoniobacterales bacterium]